MNVTKFVTLSVLAFALLCGAPLASQDVAEAVAEGVVWTEDYQGALKTAKAEKKKIFIEFTATW